MKICFLITVHFILLYAMKAQASPDSLVIKVNDEQWKLHSFGEWKVSENCLAKSCHALKVPVPGKSPASVSPWVNHPAADFCLRSGGEYLKGTYTSGDEDGVCRFGDKSFILAWDFYKKNSPSKLKP